MDRDGFLTRRNRSLALTTCNCIVIFSVLTLPLQPQLVDSFVVLGPHSWLGHLPLLFSILLLLPHFLHEHEFISIKQLLAVVAAHFYIISPLSCQLLSLVMLYFLSDLSSFVTVLVKLGVHANPSHWVILPLLQLNLLLCILLLSQEEADSILEYFNLIVCLFTHLPLF